MANVNTNCHCPTCECAVKLPELTDKELDKAIKKIESLYDKSQKELHKIKLLEEQREIIGKKLDKLDEQISKAEKVDGVLRDKINYISEDREKLGEVIFDIYLDIQDNYQIPPNKLKLLTNKLDEYGIEYGLAE
jgi:predicted ribosome quality control (RQC) complex YloA/Tae2 family protein